MTSAGAWRQVRPKMRQAGWAVLIAWAFASPVVARAWFEGRTELERAVAARDADDVEAEILHLGRALRWRVPFSTHDERALGGLWAVAAWAERNGQARRARAAYEEIRTALLGTRSLWVDHEDDLDAANEALARMLADGEAALAGAAVHADGPGLTPAERAQGVAHHRGLLERVPGPEPARAAWAAAVFVVWVVASTGLWLRGIDDRGRLLPGRGARWGLASLVSLIGWMALMARL